MIILAVDLGLARTGLAICDENEVLASPLCVIEERKQDKLVEKVCAAARERQARLLVIGLPRNMDGSEGESARHAREVATLLQEASGLPVDFCDERGTTITAHGYLNSTNTRGKKRKAVIDAVAAAIILENYLQHRRNARQDDPG